jgi:hypothetical protein
MRSTIRFVLGMFASVAVALVLSATAAASPTGPCAEVPYVGVCVPVGGAQPTPAQQNHDDYAVTPVTDGGVNAIN